MPERDAARCSCPLCPLPWADPTCPFHGTTVTGRVNDLEIDGKPYKGELIFPDLGATNSRDAAKSPDPNSGGTFYGGWWYGDPALPKPSRWSRLHYRLWRLCYRMGLTKEPW